MKAHRSLFVCFFLVSSLAIAAGADVIRVKANVDLLKTAAPLQYVVVKGDTLWDISGQFLKHPWKWPQIWRENPQIENPHLIYPGDLIILQFVNGDPRLVLERNRNVELSAEIKYLPQVSAADVIPLAVINRFLTDNQFRSSSEIDNAPYILSGAEEQILIGTNDNFYVLGSIKETDYGVFRKGDAYLDPITGEVLGIQLAHLGTAELVRHDGEIATLNVISGKQAFRRGDKVFKKLQITLPGKIYPKASAQEVTGYIVGVENLMLSAGQMDIVAINQGKRSGAEIGDILDIFSPGQVVQDSQGARMIQLPDRRVGLVVVFSIYEKMAYAMVMEAASPVKLGDILKTPEGDFIE